ncbi:MAG: L,D-transpeptidase family protein, partial [Hyphomicrobiaceae bacterium]|nr:L,D-transpeptidase family protein [Hyphomicrobiaceae bacterium]
MSGSAGLIRSIAVAEWLSADWRLLAHNTAAARQATVVNEKAKSGHSMSKKTPHSSLPDGGSNFANGSAGGPQITRRGVSAGLVSGLATGWAMGANTAQAEQNFWQIPGFGGFNDAPVRERRPTVDTLEDLRPNRVPYRSNEMLDGLDAAYLTYERIVKAGGWPALPGNRMIRPGDEDQRVPLLRRRLVAESYLKRNSGFDSFTYDGEVENAVKRFQETHGLRPSGRVDRPTLAELNISAEARLRQLRTNAQRLQELSPHRAEDRYILVNSPAFQLEAVERGDVQLRHRVIVGRPGRDTPVLRATIRAMNFFPYWRVPDSIATLDLAPRLVKEPDYLDKEKIRLVSAANGAEIDHRSMDWGTFDSKRLKFRQDPGPQNALGLVRIDMQNEHGVYMHDTPLKDLFKQRARDFSAGCVRVQDVFQLVEWLARYEPGWDQPGRAEQVVNSGQALDVNLTRPIPVYFAYITA